MMVQDRIKLLTSKIDWGFVQLKNGDTWIYKSPGNSQMYYVCTDDESCFEIEKLQKDGNVEFVYTVQDKVFYSSECKDAFVRARLEKLWNDTHNKYDMYGSGMQK